MGGCFGRIRSKRSKNKNNESNIVDRRLQPNQSASSSTSSPVIHSPNEILDERFKREIDDILQEVTASISTNYENERERIVKQMEKAAPDRYLGLDFKDYPDVNGRTVNEMARKVVTSPEAKQETFNEVHQRIASSFQSRTDAWEEADRDVARSNVRTYIEQQVQSAFTNIQLN